MNTNFTATLKNIRIMIVSRIVIIGSGLECLNHGNEAARIPQEFMNNQQALSLFHDEPNIFVKQHLVISGDVGDFAE